MSQCTRCGAEFHCAMVDRPVHSGDAAPTSGGAAGVTQAPCWCTELPMLLPVPVAGAAGCWCPDCLRAEIAAQQRAAAADQTATELQR